MKLFQTLANGGMRRALIKIVDRYYSQFWVRGAIGYVPGKCRILGKPRIIRHQEAHIDIDDHVTLNSRDESYHARMYAPVKLMADWPGASIHIGSGTRIHGSCVHAFFRVHIGRRCLIAANCQIMDANGHASAFEDLGRRATTQDVPKEVVIGDDVWLGTGVVVLPGAKIGHGTIVGANSVVKGTIPAMCIAMGNPAVPVRHYSNGE